MSLTVMEGGGGGVTSGIPEPQAYGAKTRTRDTAMREKDSAHRTYRK